MNLTKENQALITYSRQKDNLPIALAIWAVEYELRVAIITEFLEELREYVNDGLERKKLPWCVTANPNPSQWRKGLPILSITRKGSNRKICLYFDTENGKEWNTYLGGECDYESALTKEQLEPALEGIGTGIKYSHGFEWWAYIEQPYNDLGSDEALTTMNVENDRKEFVEHYGEVLLKAVEVTEKLL